VVASRSAGLTSSLRVRAEPSDRVLHRLDGMDEGVVIVKQTGTRLQGVAMKRGFGKREIVEGAERHRIGGCIGVDSPQQQPSEQREEQQHPEDAREKPHGGSVTARGVAKAAGWTACPR
jgi:hypothetical protein